jgi:hypothetical protein
MFKKLFESFEMNLFNKTINNITNHFYKYDVEDAIKTIRSTLPLSVLENDGNTHKEPETAPVAVHHSEDSSEVAASH